jgi:hypothetical protein
MKDALTLLGTTVTAVFGWTYVALVFLLGRSMGPIYVGPDVIALSMFVVAAAFYLFFRSMIARGAGGTVLRASVAVFFTVGSLFVADVFYSLYLNSRALDKPVLRESRLHDPAVVVGELVPPFYFPTDANFRLHKPGVSVHGAHYGEYYSPELRASPTLAALFEPHALTITIDGHGLRNTIPIGQADIFALGDSFTIGWALDVRDSWVGRLEAELGQSIYNLGIAGASPKQELELLKYMFRVNGDSIHVARLLWMIYEGNDLVDSYADRTPSPSAEPQTWGTLVEGTILQDVAKLPWLVKRQAIIDKILRGDITERDVPLQADDDHYVVDGVPSWFGLYDSDALGPRLFSPKLIERAGESASAILDHPNRPRLDEVFEEMARLADEHSFTVDVIIVPTAVRLHGPYYDDLPPISDEPYFIDYVVAQSEKMGFRTLDLLPLFRPYAGRELLYLRGDEHWNLRGNVVAAEAIRRELFP